MPPHERVIDLDVADRGDQVAPAIQTYTVFVACRNCNYEGEAELPKGVKVDKATCPQCACVELVRTEQVSPEQEMAPTSREQLDRIVRDREQQEPFPRSIPIAPPAQDPMTPVPMTPSPFRPSPPLIPVGAPSRVYTPVDINQNATWVHGAREDGKNDQFQHLNNDAGRVSAEPHESQNFIRVSGRPSTGIVKLW